MLTTTRVLAAARSDPTGLVRALDQTSNWLRTIFLSDPIGESDTASYVGKRQTSKITQLHDLTLQCAQSLPRGVDGCCPLFPCIPEFCYGTIARPIRP